ncbi:MAG: galactose-1-epimerase, partial [Lachnospiraceae bacterium]|nr:galactose-1-epimerase [Lachnospiraceae bacterium]
MSKRLFGTTKDGKEVYTFTLTNANKMQAEVINYGCILTKLLVPDADGKVDDVVLGYDTLAPYEVNPSFFGAVIAPSANRIKDAKFTIDGVEYKVDVNDGPNNLHSHVDKGAHKQVWNFEEGNNYVKFTYEYKDK